MLVRSMKTGESFIIGEGRDQITVKINWIRGNVVSLAIEAGKHIHIVRSELVAKGGK